MGTAYALEGNIIVSAQAAAFMATLLGVGDAGALSDLAQTIDSANGVTFVPALSGLGAPHWDDRATGTISGMTHGTRPAHLARATFEAIAIADRRRVRRHAGRYRHPARQSARRWRRGLPIRS